MKRVNDDGAAVSDVALVNTTGDGLTIERRMSDTVAPNFRSDGRGRALVPLLCGLWLVLGTLCLFSGPVLSSHETIVAQIARQTVRDGDWLVPRYLDAPFLVKPPLAPWMAALASYLLPLDPMTQLPGSTTTARLPSLLATMITMAVLYALARSMFGRGVAWCTVFVYATSAGTLAFALNGTAEAVLTLFCTWAYAEFWWSRRASGRDRLIHQVRFYIALMGAMMAKAPMPLIVVAVPLAGWWWAERPTRLLARLGPRTAFGAVRVFGRGCLSRLREGTFGLGLWWGIPIAMVPLFAWGWAASLEVPYFWRLWQVEYLSRLHDKGIWGGYHGPLYYLPFLFGLTAPWLLSLPEALCAPFLKRYSECRAPLVFAWYWTVIATLVLSVMRYKQDYYLLPVLPGAALLLGPVLHRLFFVPSPPASPVKARMVMLLALTVVLSVSAAGAAVFWDEMGSRRWECALPSLVILGPVFVGGVIVAACFFLHERKSDAFHTVGLTGLVAFALVWHVAGSDRHQLREQAELVTGLRQAGVCDHQELFWIDSVPEGRVTFYFDRWVRPLGDPFEMRSRFLREDKQTLVLEIVSKLRDMLARERVYMVVERDKFAMLNSVFGLEASVLLEVDRLPKGIDGEDWLVLTNGRQEVASDSKGIAASTFLVWPQHR